MNIVPLKIAFAGSATNPSTLGHFKVLRLILKSGFDLVIWYPSGFSTKPGLDQTIDIHRQQLALLAFPQSWIHRPRSGWAKLMLNLDATMKDDVPTATRFAQIRDKYPQAEVSFITGSDAVTPDATGIFPLQNWFQYQEVLSQERILIVPRAGFARPGEIELPQGIQWLTHKVLPDIQSSTIRRLIATGDDRLWLKMVNAKVADYINLYQLYRQAE